MKGGVQHLSSELTVTNEMFFRKSTFAAVFLFSTVFYSVDSLQALLSRIDIKVKKPLTTLNSIIGTLI